MAMDAPTPLGMNVFCIHIIIKFFDEHTFTRINLVFCSCSVIGIMILYIKNALI